MAAARSVSIPHYAWAGGHALVLAGTIYTLIGLVTFQSRSKSYYLSYLGAIVSWGIVVYKSLGIPQPNKAYIQRALLDENVQYLILAVYWFLQKPIYITLIPFATFSLFHTLTFVRTSVLPKPPSTPAGASKTAAPPATGQAKLSKQIQTWVKANYEKAMLFVAFVEVVLVFGRVLLGAITFRNSLLAPLFFAHFLRLRYYLSPPTRQAFAWVSTQVDHGINHPSCPAPVKKGVTIARDLIIRYSESVLQVGGQAGAQQPGAAGAAGARPAAAGAAARPAPTAAAGAGAAAGAR
ncbi:BZ3500_MvSof-1268-A1-R1_Chr5-2g07848 [Microbotryum saponariae]|uniref:BZ3500_MvSof-1268-A1-R1_Chr5-2g07848 protein n=1 Tax=Microbotryum saponariae TaxID=289078 RepID=A0A2X0NJW9_9BASI|nr:BZ3500_MvSof-1268-A1-R1_Chr5-2g07848 [Microbotryum saponariae]SDA05717.1 BZ3501_MvSof-1269-A2-R1_Chr5-2g07670 [Microbotryum saponariae]